MTEQQKQIWNYLQKHSIGMSNAIHVADLARNLGFEPYGTNNDEIRKEIERLGLK